MRTWRARLEELKQMKEIRDRETKEKTAIAARTVRTAPAAPPEPLGRLDAVKRISAWIEHDFLNDKVTYAEVVDWYDQGLVSREEVLKDRAKYVERWPERKYMITPGSVQILPSGPNRYVTTFEQTYVVRSAPRKAHASGKSRLMVDVEITDGKLRVVRQKEIVGRQ
jgi:hypothetical protein